MIILGIETSCDETSAAVLRNGKLLSNIVSSSLARHRRFGGIVPEIAHRAHMETITRVTDSAIDKAEINFRDIDRVCVTNSPGLSGALLVGVSFARALSLALNVPVLELDHLKSHIFANFLNSTQPKFPFIGFVVSGGHTSIFLVKNISQWKILGSTRDDAVGEAYDKVAKIMGLGFPGGPVVEKSAAKGNPNRINLSCADFKNSFDFSFSGIKTAVFYKFQKLQQLKSVSRKDVYDISASFQKSIIGVLVKKVTGACEKYRIKTLVMGGGVTVNDFLRKELFKEARAKKIKLFFPKKEFCLDNAAMVAAFGYALSKAKRGKA